MISSYMDWVAADITAKSIQEGRGIKKVSGDALTHIHVADGSGRPEASRMPNRLRNLNRHLVDVCRRFNVARLAPNEN